MLAFTECQNLDQLMIENTYMGTSLSAPQHDKTTLRVLWNFVTAHLEIIVMWS